jgi:hypothetical protein
MFFKENQTSLNEMDGYAQKDDMLAMILIHFIESFKVALSQRR